MTRSMRLCAHLAASTLIILGNITAAASFVSSSMTSLSRCTDMYPSKNEVLPSRLIMNEMKRPILDQLATTLLKLENDRVEKSSELDEKGRVGEPMAWSEGSSMANQLSELMASGPGYMFKQLIADLVAGEYNTEETELFIDDFVKSAIANRQVAMFSFSTCPFCRRAKDYLEASDISYSALELDKLDGNRGNEIRASLGKKVKRTSVPAIWIGDEFVGGCNDGPGLLTLANQGKLKSILDNSGISCNLNYI